MDEALPLDAEKEPPYRRIGRFDVIVRMVSAISIFGTIWAATQVLPFVGPTLLAGDLGPGIPGGLVLIVSLFIMLQMAVWVVLAICAMALASGDRLYVQRGGKIMAALAVTGMLVVGAVVDFAPHLSWC